MKELQRMIQQHRKFVTKDYVGFPFEHWFVSSKKDTYMHERYPRLWLTTYPAESYLGRVLYGNILGTDNAIGVQSIKRIGNIPVHLTRYSNTSKRYIFIDMRTVDEMLYEAYNELDMERSNIKYTNSTLVSYTTEAIKIQDIINNSIHDLKYPSIQKNPFNVGR